MAINIIITMYLIYLQQLEDNQPPRQTEVIVRYRGARFPHLQEEKGLKVVLSYQIQQNLPKQGAVKHWLTQVMTPLRSPQLSHLKIFIKDK